jgi:hypothetical protein
VSRQNNPVSRLSAKAAFLQGWLLLVLIAAAGFSGMAALSGCGGGSNPTPAPHVQTIITVTNTNDSGSGSLRDAITQANSDNDGDTIEISATGTITLASSLPAIAANMTIQGPGAGNLAVSGANAHGIFTVNSGTTVSITGITIANGATSGNGGGISNSGVLTLNSDAFSGNSATGSGAAIVNNVGPLTVTNSIFVGNSATDSGGAIGNNLGTLTVTNSTFNGNSAAGLSAGGAIANTNSNNTLTVVNSTFSGNSAYIGGAIESQGTGTLSNNIFSGNTATGGGGGIAQTYGTINASYNVYWHNLANGSESDCDNCSSNSNATSGDPKLLLLSNWGGTTQTLLPAPGSAAICAGSAASVPSGVTTDQRGFPLDSSCVDAGAVQTNYVAYANASFSGLEDVDLTGLSGTVSAAVTISGEVNLVGPGTNQLTLSGTNANTVININSRAQAAIYGLTIANGHAYIGGGINNNGTLTVINSTISGNSAEVDGFGGGEGGGINNNATLTVINSTISGNSVPGGSGYGGGIANGGAMTVTNSTISGNSAPAGYGGGIYGGYGANLTNSIVAGNSAGSHADIEGNYQDNGGNVASNNSSGTSTIAINLSPRGYYGGPTETMPPLPDSPALNAGTYRTGEPATDQRGSPRPSTAGAKIDSGSVQISNQIR